MYEKNVAATGLEREAMVARLEQILQGLSQHWLAWTNLLWGIMIGSPWLAPILMQG